MKDKSLREILNGVYLDAKGMQEIDERIANGTVSLAIADILKLVPSEVALTEFVISKMGGILPRNREWMYQQLAKNFHALIIKKLGGG